MIQINGSDKLFLSFKGKWKSDLSLSNIKKVVFLLLDMPNVLQLCSPFCFPFLFISLHFFLFICFFLLRVQYTHYLLFLLQKFKRFLFFCNFLKCFMSVKNHFCNSAEVNTNKFRANMRWDIVFTFNSQIIHYFWQILLSTKAFNS